ncbi:hypothetical protein C8R43DRAFT_943740 [Mycena crocata]|nr:hypothetical protein C8R43DRAFT_943740 [Mycena crocata]
MDGSLQDLGLSLLSEGVRVLEGCAAVGSREGAGSKNDHDKALVKELLETRSQAAIRAAEVFEGYQFANVLLHPSLKNYTDATKDISGKAYPLINACMSYGELAAKTEKIFGGEVTFTTGEPTGGGGWSWTNFMQLMALREYESVFSAADIDVANPELAALGAKFGTVEEYLTLVKQ